MTNETQIQHYSEVNPLHKVLGMHPAVKEAWLARLLQPGRKQGRLMLAHKSPETGSLCFCAVGELADLYAEDMGAGWKTSGGLPEQCYLSTDPCENRVRLPVLVKEWAGLTTDAVDNVIRMNDYYNLPYEAIAEYINEEL